MDTHRLGLDTLGRGGDLSDRFRAHATDAEHLYGYAMRGMAENWEAGGPIRTVSCRALAADPDGPQSHSSAASP